MNSGHRGRSVSAKRFIASHGPATVRDFAWWSGPPLGESRAAAVAASAIGPSKNGMVRAILLAHGDVVGAWNHSSAVGRHREPPVPELLVAGSASKAEVTSALARYASFVAG